MPHQDGLIYKNSSSTPKQGVSIADIQQTLGSGKNDIGSLVTSGKVNAFSKVHPQDVNHIAPASSTERVNMQYGITIPEYLNQSSLSGTNAKWTYKKGSWYRLDDFDGYYQYAQDPILTCPVKGTIVVNAVDENHQTSIPFYVFSLNGSRSTNWLYNRSLDETTGVKSADAVASGKTQYCISIEEVTTDGGNALISNHAYFGILLFTGTSTLTYSSQKYCSAALSNTSSTQNNNMFRLPTSGLPTGDYTAIPCIRLGNPFPDVGETVIYKYIPLCRYPIDTGATYPCKFTLKVGGVDFYTVNVLGVATSASGTPSLSLTTTATTIYLFVSVTNNSGKDSYTSPGNTLEYWLEKPTLTANITYADSTTWTSSRVSDTSLESPTSAFTIQNGGSQTLVYQINKIWNENPTDPAKVVDSGYVNITSHLYFWQTGQPSGDEFGTGSLQDVIRVTYGIS